MDGVFSSSTVMTSNCSKHSGVLNVGRVAFGSVPEAIMSLILAYFLAILLVKNVRNLSHTLVLDSVRVGSAVVSMKQFFNNLTTPARIPICHGKFIGVVLPTRLRD